MRAIGELVDAFRRREGKAVTRARNLIVAALAAGRKCYHYDRQHLVGRVLGPERGGMPDWISPAAENTAFGRGDVLVIGSQLGALVIGIAPARAAEGERLSASSEVFIATGGADRVVRVLGGERVGSTVSFGNVVALWAVQSEMAERLAAAGRPPSVWMNVFLKDADAAASA